MAAPDTSPVEDIVADFRRRMELKYLKIQEEVWTEPFMRYHARADAAAQLSRLARRVLPEPAPPQQQLAAPTIVVIQSNIPNTPVDGVHDYRPPIDVTPVPAEPTG